MSTPAGTGIKDPPQTLWGILSSIGPGLILSANIVGTGELIATTRLGSQVGFLLLWFILFACAIKVFVQVELGRYTISEGVGSLEILNRLPGPRVVVRWTVWLWILMYVGTLFQVSGMIGGVAELFAGSQERSATVPYALAGAALCAGLLVAGRYTLVEKLSTLMVVAFSITTVLAVGLLQVTASRVTLADLATGFSFRLPDDVTTSFAVFGMTGVGAAELMFYPIWCLEKGYARFVGLRDDSAAWEARARGWMRVMRWDAWCSMVIYTVATTGFYLLGAAILHRQGKVVADQGTMQTLSAMYTGTFGAPGAWVFFVGAFMVLYSTYFVSTASNARLFADVAGLLGIFRYRSPEARTRIVKAAVIVIPGYTLLAYYIIKAPVTMVLIGGTAQALMLPFLGFAAVWCRRRIAPSLAAGPAWTACLLLSTLAMAVVGLFQAGQQTGLWRALGWLK